MKIAGFGYVIAAVFGATLLGSGVARAGYGMAAPCPDVDAVSSEPVTSDAHEPGTWGHDVSADESQADRTPATHGKLSAAVRVSTQHEARHRHHVRRHHADPRHQLVARSDSHSSAPQVPAPSHSRTQQPARIPGTHLRAQDQHAKFSPRHAALASLAMPRMMLPVCAGPDIELGTMTRIDIWRSEGRGPPRAAPLTSLLAAARRPSTLLSGARSILPTSIPSPASDPCCVVTREPFGSGSTRSIDGTQDMPRGVSGRALAVPPLRTESPWRGAALSTGAPSGLLRLPSEGTAAEFPLPSSSGGLT